MKRIAYTLSMPSNNSWDGRWSGASKKYVIVREYRDSKADSILSRRSYGYNFGDGWAAGVNVREVDSTEARELRRDSDGFCGYDWMVNSIEFDGDIYGPMRLKPEPAAQGAK